jgi:DNA end-binding protein Ku
MRGINGNLAWGNAIVPIRMYKATEDGTPHFANLHDKDQGRLSMKRVCSVCNEPLTDENTVLGYEVGKDMVIFTKDEVKGLKAKDNGFQLYGFCDLADIHDIFLLTEGSYFVGTADKKKSTNVGIELFNLLNKGMIKANKVALVSWTTRGQKHIGVMMPYGDGFLLKEIHFASEIRDMNEVELERVQVKESALDKAVARINKMGIAFDHEHYHDDFAETVNKLVQMRALGGADLLETEPAVIERPSSAEELLSD